MPCVSSRLRRVWILPHDAVAELGPKNRAARERQQDRPSRRAAHAHDSSDTSKLQSTPDKRARCTAPSFGALKKRTFARLPCAVASARDVKVSEPTAYQ